jgi:hypothetical protein
VPVDGTPFREHALPLALGIARRLGATIRVVHVHLPLPRRLLYRESGLDLWLRRRQRDYLDDLMRRLRRVTRVPVKPVFLEGRQVSHGSRHGAGHRTGDLPGRRL